MKIIEKYQTKDGYTFATEMEALKHLERLISNKVFYLADMIFADSRVQMVEYIMEHLEDFQELIDLNNDKEITNKELS